MEFLSKQLQDTNAPEPAASLNNVVNAWQMVDFANLQLSLIDQSTQILELEEKRISQRSNLAKKTKEYREGGIPVDELIKLYQKGLDELTTQTKFNQNCFLTLFKILRDLPDPYDRLSASLQEIEELSKQLKALQEREEHLSLALKNSREKAKGVDELRAEREQFRENVQLDGQATLDKERVLAQERLLTAETRFEEETQKLQSQLDLALEEIERLNRVVIEQQQIQQYGSTLDRLGSSDDGSSVQKMNEDLNTARNEGFQEAEHRYKHKLEEAAKAMEASTAQYQEQLDELRATISSQMDQLSAMKEQLLSRPDPEEYRRMKAHLQIMTRLNDPNNNNDNNDKEDSSSVLDGLEAWLLATNQRLVEECKQLKQELVRLKNNEQQTINAASNIPPVPASPAVPEDPASSLPALKSQRDRLRAVLEKRDLEIERLQNQLDEKDVRYRRLDDETEKLRQRVRFLQSYKVSERSTLLPANAPSDPEAQSGTALLGRGVSHEFRQLWEMPLSGGRSNKVPVFRGFKDMRVAIGFYVIGMHLLLLYTVFHCFQTTTTT